MVKSKSCDFMGDGLESSLAVIPLLDSTCSGLLVFLLDGLIVM